MVDFVTVPWLIPPGCYYLSKIVTSREGNPALIRVTDHAETQSQRAIGRVQAKVPSRCSVTLS